MDLSDIFSGNFEETFQHGDKTYLLTRIPARKAWHIIRRMAPLLTKLSVFSGMDKETQSLFLPADEAGPDNGGKMKKLFELLSPLLENLSDLPDETMDYVINSCLSHVRVETAKGIWTSLFNPNANMFMVEVGAGDMLMLTTRVLMVLLPDFLGVRGQTSTPPDALTD